MLVLMQTDTIAAEARAITARQGIRRTQIAEALGLTVWQVGRRLAGQVDFSAAEIATLANLAGVAVAEFYPASLNRSA